MTQNHDTDTLPDTESHLRERHTRYSPELARNDHQLDFDLPAQRAATEGSILDRSIDDAPRATLEILHGDAFQLIERLADDSVDLIITSPPYWGQRTYGLEHNWGILHEWEKQAPRSTPPSWEWYRDHGGILGLEPVPEWYVCNLVSFFHRAAPKLKCHGSVWINIGDTYLQDGRASGIKDDRGSATIGASGEERRWEDTFRRNSFC